ncbi:hypothetical protein I4U23_016190 [Adineta vaga]|nr:hypothetical protein I4U23_016190 [Adineta vaga]
MEKSRLAKLFLVLTCIFGVITIVCFCVGISLFFDQYSKSRDYKEDLCQVQSSTYERIDKCIKGDSRRGTKLGKCYVPVWTVQIGQNQTLKQNIRTDADFTLQHAMNQLDKFKLNSIYPCWYNTKKISEITWYKPTTYYSFILLIISGIFLPFSIISCILLRRFRQDADL